MRAGRCHDTRPIPAPAMLAPLANRTPTDPSIAMTRARLLNATPLATALRDDDMPLLALHCSGAGGRAFDGWRRRLPDAARLLTPDLMGSGAEPVWPLGAATSLAAEAARLAALLPPQGVHVFGHSYGGAVALELARHWPERVRSLTLYEPVRFALLDDTPVLWRAITEVGRRIGALTLAGRRRRRPSCSSTTGPALAAGRRCRHRARRCWPRA
jgi:pimeloyl-ACP methyl ester carboxylesterase